MFAPNANLNKMVKSDPRVAVNDVIHKAKIEINEEGTKAAGISGKSYPVDNWLLNFSFITFLPYLLDRKRSSRTEFRCTSENCS